MSYFKKIRAIDFLFEDDDIAVVNKPSGLLSIADRYKDLINLKNILLKKYGTIYTVHRLDKDTSGVMLFAKNETTHKFLNQQFSNRMVKKIYWAFVQNSPEIESGIVDMPILNDIRKTGKMYVNPTGKPAETKFKLLKDYGKISLMAFFPITGRTHQIRVHSKYLGCPLLIDSLYTGKEAFYLSAIKKRYKKEQFSKEKPLVSRLTLHAKSIEFTHPNGEKMSFETELPKDLKALKKQLDKWAR